MLKNTNKEHKNYVSTTQLEKKIFTSVFKSEFNNRIKDIIAFKQRFNNLKIDKIKDELIKIKIKIDIDYNINQIAKTHINQLTAFYENDKNILTTLSLVFANRTSKRYLKTALLVSVGLIKEIKKILFNDSLYNKDYTLSYQEINNKILENSFIPAHNYIFQDSIKIILEQEAYKSWFKIHGIIINDNHVFNKALKEKYENDKYNFIDTA